MAHEGAFMVFKPNVTVAAVIERQGRYLLVEEMIDGRRVFNQPAGHLEENESLLEAVRREVLEETAWHFEPQSLVAVQLYRASATLTFLRFAFSGKVYNFDSNRRLDSGILATRWMSRGEIEAKRECLRSPLVLASVAAYESGQRFSLDMLQSFF
jgi:8-oxo-dGTP pyrophosphatase MutT (NUDIX family)